MSLALHTQVGLEPGSPAHDERTTVLPRPPRLPCSKPTADAHGIAHDISASQLWTRESVAKLFWRIRMQTQTKKPNPSKRKSIPQDQVDEADTANAALVDHAKPRKTRDRNQQGKTANTLGRNLGLGSRNLTRAGKTCAHQSGKAFATRGTLAERVGRR